MKWHDGRSFSEPDLQIALECPLPGKLTVKNRPEADYRCVRRIRHGEGILTGSEGAVLPFISLGITNRPSIQATIESRVSRAGRAGNPLIN
jgi:hypothetical protein